MEAQKLNHDCQLCGRPNAARDLSMNKIVCRACHETHRERVEGDLRGLTCEACHTTIYGPVGDIHGHDVCMACFAAASILGNLTRIAPDIDQPTAAERTRAEADAPRSKAETAAESADEALIAFEQAPTVVAPPEPPTGLHEALAVSADAAAGAGGTVTHHHDSSYLTRPHTCPMCGTRKTLAVFCGTCAPPKPTPAG